MHQEIDFENDIEQALTSAGGYRLQKISEGAIDLKAGEPEALYGPTEVGTGQPDEDVQLSTLVGKLNERFGTEFTPADQLFFDQVRETAIANEQLRQAVMANSIENFEPVFNKQLENLFIERMFEQTRSFILAQGDDIIEKPLKLYVAFRRLKNFVCMSLISKLDPHVFLILKLDPASLALEPGFSRDVSKIGHWGTGDLELSLRTPADFEKARALIERAYQEN